MRYMLLIYSDEQAEAGLSPEEFNELVQAYFRYDDELRRAGKYVFAEALQPSSTATVVRVREGKTLVTDGPYAETKEQLGGFYVIEAESLDEALRWAARIPGAATGTIEVRPVMEFD
jgi:hypothetical protein